VVSPQTDLAAWLIDHRHAGDASVLLDEARTVLESLGGAPALARAQKLRDSLPAAVASR
jgi:hypothetical protein